MSTAEIAAVAAAAIVVLIIVIVLVARGRGDKDEEPQTPAANQDSMFDRPPSDTLEGLGKPERPGETPALADTQEPDAGDLEPAAAQGEREPSEAAGTAGIEPPETEPVGETPEAEGRPAGELAAAEAPAGGHEAEAPVEGNLVALSSIIVTTSNKMVDLGDPEVRRMLTDLVTFEIDQAGQFRKQGQTIDAVLQLTEAEKICRALGKEDTAHEIREMMRDLHA